MLITSTFPFLSTILNVEPSMFLRSACAMAVTNGGYPENGFSFATSGVPATGEVAGGATALLFTTSDPPHAENRNDKAISMIKLEKIIRMQIIISLHPEGVRRPAS